MHQDVSLLSLNEVCKRVGLSRATLYRIMKDPARSFPEPCQPWPGAKRWRSDEIQAWIDGVSAERAGLTPESETPPRRRSGRGFLGAGALAD